MAEIDPVILEIRAELTRYRADLRTSTEHAERAFARQERGVQRLEKQMLKSSTAIQGTLGGLAAAFAGAFSAQQITGLIDNFTRLQNSLRVSGLEGENLARVQGELLVLSGRYGVNIGELANLYGKSAQAASDLGASEAQLLQITEASAQALKITGTSAAQAQGALLGLTQALASGTVRAEEFNQINEGGLRPLLQVVANTEKYGGSVAKLRMAIVDGKVSSQEFYQAILNGSAELDAKASKTALTLAGAFESLTSQLTIYVGEASQASGVTTAMAVAIQTMAKNLDIMIPALAVIATVLGGRFLAGALAGGTALRSLAAYASIATTSLAGTALAARAAGAALLAALGGPVALAITAVVLALGYAAANADDFSRASEAAKKSSIAAGEGSSRASKAIDQLAASYGKARVEALALVEAQRKIALSAAFAAQAESLAAERNAANVRRTAQRNAAVGASGVLGPVGRLAPIVAQKEIGDAEASARVAGEASRTAFATLNRLEAALKAPPASAPSMAVGGDGKKAKGAGGGAAGPSGPSATEIESRFNQEMLAIAQQTLSVRQGLATTAEERAELEARGVENARRQTLLSLAADKDYNDAQRAAVKEAVDKLADLELERISRERTSQLEEDARAIADERYQAERDSLAASYDLAQSQAERRELALAIIDLEYRQREAVLQSVIASETAAEADKERARIGLASLANLRGKAEAGAMRSTAGPLEAAIDAAKMDAAELNELYQQIAVDGLKSLNDGLTNAIMNSESLGDVFKNVAKQIIADLIRIAIQQTIVNSLMSAFGLGGGGGGGLFGGLFGRASGGFVQAGQMVRVNEGAGAGRVEGFRPTGSGTVIPLGQMNQAGMGGVGGQGQTVTVRLALSGDIDAKIDQRSAMVAVEVVRETAPTLIDAAANEALTRAQRPTL